MNGIQNLTMAGVFSTGTRWTIQKGREAGPCGAEGCRGVRGEFTISAEGQTVPLSQLGTIKQIHAKLKEFGVDNDDYADEVHEVVSGALTVIGTHVKADKPAKAAKKKARRRR